MERTSQSTYRHEGLTAVIEVQSAKNDLALASLVTLGPGSAKQVPLRTEFPAHLTAEAGIHRSQKHRDGVVAGQSSDLFVCGIVDLHRSRGQGFLMVLGEPVAGILGEGAYKEQGEREEDRGPAHRGGQWEELWQDKRRG